MLQYPLYASLMPRHPKVKAAACEAKQMSRVLNAMASKSECLSIGSALKKKYQSYFDSTIYLAMLLCNVGSNWLDSNSYKSILLQAYSFHENTFLLSLLD